MEAVPRLHMLWFALKSSPEGTSFTNLKKYIAEFYQEDADSYSKEVFALETLRNQAMHPTKDGCSIMKRYYCQLHSLQNRFPQLLERGIFTFTWKDLYQSHVNEVTDMRYELAAVLFNIAASHTQVGASVTRGDVDGIKLACTHFQCAGWAFGELRERYANINSSGDFMTVELLVFMQQVSYAQAQECILEKSLLDNRKPIIVAKVAAQIVVYYGAALAALLTGGDDGPIAQVIDSSVYKLWKKYVRFKISYLSCILYLYQGQHSEEQQKMGERVTLYQAAYEKLEEARKESKGLPDQREINESLVFTADVVEGKRKNAKNENEFIYHEAVPELSSITAVPAANLIKGISFNVTDPEVAGEDIFARLVPMKAHEASSMYSEEKAKLLRKYGSKIEEKDAELISFMSSLTLDNLNISEEKANKIPQGIVDRCAALNASKNAIPDLIAAMSQLAEICADVELNLKEIASILAEEERQEQEFQKLTGVKRTPNAHITELTREFQKYNEAHTRAGESNDTLRKAMELHVNNLKILARPLQEIQQSVPKLSTELNTTELFKDVKLIVNKVNEMKAQRSQFHADLRIAVNDDDITAKVIAHGSEEGLQALFERELNKHERLTQLLDQNLLAQTNILQALTESYAKAAPVLKTLADVKHKREGFFSSLAASYDVYEDLLAKSAKGLEFYKKLSGNVQKLLTRFKGARDVQSEERQQRLKSVGSHSTPPPTTANANLSKDVHMPTIPAAPKLRDYLKAKNTSAANIAAAGSSGATSLADTTINSAQCVPPVRPSPLGSENPTQSACSSSYYQQATPALNMSTAPNEPPPPYSLQQTQYYDPGAAGYTNPMYQQQQQNIAPPAYKLQASPNSQFSNVAATASLNTNMANLTLQGNYGNMAASQLNQQQLYATTANPNVSSTYSPQQQQSMGTIGNSYGSLHPQQQPQQQQMSNYNYSGLSQQQQQAAQSTYITTNTPQQTHVTPNTVLNQYSNMYNAAAGIGNYQQQPSSGAVGLMSSPQSVPLTGYTSTQPVSSAAGILANQQQTSAAGYSIAQVPMTASGLLVTQAVPTTSLPNIQSTTPLGVQQMAAPNVVSMQQMYQTQNLHYPKPPTQQQCEESHATGTVLATQPLYVSTSAPDGTKMVTSLAQQEQQRPPQPLPATLQAPCIVNPLQPHAVASSMNPTATVSEERQVLQSANVITQPQAIPPTDASSTYTPYGGTTKHPGYSFNSQTGNYEYGSGYQQAAAFNSQFYGQYTSAKDHRKLSNTTDSELAHAMNVATGFDSPVISHTKSAALSAENKPADDKLNYYTPPYGHHSNNASANYGNPSGYGIPQLQQHLQHINIQEQTQNEQLQAVRPQTPSQYTQHSTYMQSGGASIANTQTTKSAAKYASSSQLTPSQMMPAADKVEGSTADVEQKPIAPKQAPKRTSNIDLLTDIDFSGAGQVVPPPLLPTPVLKPKVLASPPASLVNASATMPSKSEQKDVENKPTTAVEATSPPPPPSTLTPLASLHLSSPLDSPAALAHKSSYDNLSICSDLSSLDTNFDFDSASVAPIKNTTTDKHSTGLTTASTLGEPKFLMELSDAYYDDSTLKHFHKDVERYEKIIESLNVKMLNGHTQLSAKWKEIQDALSKEATKRTTTIAKLFPEKNRSLDCLPYDHARVKLEKNTDDYINAAYIKNLGTGCPNFIIAQTPQQNTISDFWSMMWSQKARTALCLHTPNEMLDPFWSQELNTEAHFDDYSIKCVGINMLSHCVEYNLKLSMHGADAIIDLSILQIKAWTKSAHSQVLGIARNALRAHQQHCLEFNTPNSPLVMNCLTGSERSELIAIAIAAIQATQYKRPVLINIADVWQRICAQRQNALRDQATLAQSMQIVLSHAHDVLNKRGIMTSYQMKIAPQAASKEKEEIKDPLNDLDPLWKLKIND